MRYNPHIEQLLEELRINPRWIDEKEVSRMTGFALPTLRNHRYLGVGIPYIKATSRAIRYSVEDVISFMESRRIVPRNDFNTAGGS